MENENGTLNNDGSSSIPNAGTGDLISTMDFQSADEIDPGAANNTQDPGANKEEDPKNPSGEEKPSEETDPAGDTRFDKHPRFQQLISERNELREAIQGLEDRLAAFEGGGQGGDEPPPNYRDMSQMSNEELLDWQSENPKEFIANLAQQIFHEARQALNQERDQRETASSHEQQLVQTFSTFADKHEDFMPMWEDGTIKDFMRKNPGHNAISAYYVLTDEQRIAEAEGRGRQKTQTEILNNHRVKSHARVMSAGPSRGTGTGDPNGDLRNTKVGGGLIATLAARSQARMRAQT